MTNEQLAEDIQKNSDKDLTAVLWQRVKGICFKLAGGYYSKYAEKFNSCGVEFEDVKQECYFAFLQAVKAYKSDSGLKFTSYLNYPILNACRDLLGIRNKEGLNRSPLDNYTSLDVPINAEEENEITLLDTVEDETALESYENALQSISDEQTRKVLTESINRLEPPLKAVIMLYYFEDMEFSQIAELQGVSADEVRKRKNKALNQLRKMPEIRILREENHAEEYLHFHTTPYTYEDYMRERAVSATIRRGSVLTEKRKQQIKFNCQLEKALDECPEYNLYLALAKSQNSIDK